LKKFCFKSPKPIFRAHRNKSATARDLAVDSTNDLFPFKSLQNLRPVEFKLHSKSEVDLILIVGPRDIRFIRFTLLSIAQFWKPAQVSSVKLVVSPKDAKYVRSILNLIEELSSPNIKFSILDRQKIQDLIAMPSLSSQPSYVTQRYLKVFAHLFSSADFLWFVDSDYLLTAFMSEEDFVINGSTKWIYSDWVESSVSEVAWRKGSEIMLGEEITHNFMMNPPFICKREDLINISRIVNDEKILLAQEGFSEFVYIGAFCFREQVATTRFIHVELGDPTSYSSWVHQNPTTGELKLNLNGTEADFDNSSFIVFWSHIAEIEDLMEKKLMSLNFRENLGITFSHVIKDVAPKERIRTFKRENLKEELIKFYSYSDGWLYGRIAFQVMGGWATTLEFKLPTGVEIELLDSCNSKIRVDSSMESVSLKIPWAITGKLVAFQFKSTLVEAGTFRTLYAQIV
jgi:hypothetical protein